MQLALFDFDGTLTKGDTLFPYLRYVSGERKFFTGLLGIAPALGGYAFGLKPNWKAKEEVAAWYLKGRSQRELEKLGELFVTELLPNMLRDEALERLQWHREAGHDIYIVSASFEEWLLPFSREVGVGLICTRLKYEQGVFTGKLATRNCHGLEKVRRVQQELDIAAYEKIYAYGDSRAGDMPMLGLADEPFFRKFA